MTDSEIELLSDGTGLAVIGDADAVDHFLVSEGLVARDLGIHRLGGGALAVGSGVAQAGSEIAAGSGRWVKLTEESAAAVKKYGLRESKRSGLRTGVVKSESGKNIGGFVEFVSTPKSILSNPAALAGAAGLMAQLAMKQSMDEITDYLATIDAKVDEVLRAQTDAVVAQIVGLGFVIDEAMALREERGRVDEITWSKVQSAPSILGHTQAYALRRLDNLAQGLERTKVGDLADAAREAEEKAQEWVAVLARCFQLQDAVAVLELDRVLDASPDELDAHRRGLESARRRRVQAIAQTTERLLARADAAAGTANAKVLMHPSRSRDVVSASNEVAVGILDFHRVVGIADDREPVEARRWSEAAVEKRDRAVARGLDGVGTARRVGGDAVDRARSTASRVPARVASRRRRDGR